MALRDNRQAIAAGPGFTDLLATTPFGGTDGDVGVAAVLVTCASDSAVPIEYRVGQDETGATGELKPGEVVKLDAHAGPRPIELVQARGVGGAAIGGVERVAV